MADGIVIPLKADDKQIKQATKSLGMLEKALNWVGKAAGENKDDLAKFADILSPFASVAPAFASAIKSYIIAPLFGAVNGFMALGDQISKTSQRIGMSTETLGGLKFAAEQCGANFEILTEGIKAFQNQLGAAQMGDTGAISKLGKVGLNADDFAGLSNEDQLMKLADHIKSIGDKSEQTRVSMELFGKAGFKLLPFFQEGSAGIKKLIAEGKDIGAVLGEDGVQSAVELTDAMNRMKTSLASVTNSFMAGLAPTITSTLDLITTCTKYVTKFLNEWGLYVGVFAGSVAIFANYGTILKGLGALLPQIAAGFKAFGAAIAANPLLVGGAVVLAGVIAGFALWNKHLDATIERMYKITDEAQKHREEVERAQEADQKLFDRLKELDAIEDPLSNNEIAEASKLIKALTERYGDLGISIDKDTGKIRNMISAQEKLMEAQKAEQLRALDAEIAEANRNIESLQKRREKKRFNVLQWMSGSMDEWYEKNQLEEDKWTEQKFAAMRKRDALKNGYSQGASAPKTLEDLHKQNTEYRAKENAAKEERLREIEKRNSQLEKDLQAARDSKKDPYTLQLEKVDRDLAKSVENLDELIQLNKKNGNAEEVARLQRSRKELEAAAAGEKEKITQEHKAKQEEEWKAQNPERDHLEQKDPRIARAEAAVQAARDKQAAAIFHDKGVEEANEELKKAQDNLARILMTVHGTARQNALRELNEARRNLAYSGPRTPNAVYNQRVQAVRDAQAKYEQENEAYFAAAGSLRKEKEIDLGEAVQRITNTGTFSAYGMDAAVAYDIPQKTLDVLMKLLDNTDEIKKEQKNEGSYTK